MSYNKQQGFKKGYGTCKNQGCGIRLFWQESETEFKDDGSKKKIPMEVDAQDRPTVRHRCEHWQGAKSGGGSNENRSYSSYQQQQQSNKPQVKTVWQPKTFPCNRGCGTELFWNNDDTDPRTGRGTLYEVQRRIPHKCSGGNTNAPTPTNRGYGGGNDPAPFGMSVNTRRDAGAVVEQEVMEQGWG